MRRASSSTASGDGTEFVTICVTVFVVVMVTRFVTTGTSREVTKFVTTIFTAPVAKPDCANSSADNATILDLAITDSRRIAR